MSPQVAQIASANVHVHDLFSLEGRVALVTGGAGHYGRQISQALAEAGATVLIASRDFSKCEKAACSLRRSGFIAEPMPLDLSAEDSVNTLADRVRSEWRRLDILFNNAVTVSTGAVERYPSDEWARVMECNSLGLYRACRTFGALMAERKSGSIVNVASIYGVVSPDFNVYGDHTEMINPPSYSFAKGGMIQLTRYLAVHFASYGVRVNCMSPGGYYVPQMPEEFVANYCHRTPIGRMAGPNDIKGPAVFLASDASAYITGQNILVDGGYTAI
jgi:NAD(P)-dependent dehydrogenase (short-subunit alcohol dehydrogenase family)